MKRILLSALLLMGPAGWAQKQEAPGQAKKDDRLELERTSIDEATEITKMLDLGKAANLSSVEAKLTALNEAKPGSAEWRIESAQRLVHLAEQVARSGKPANVAVVVQRALQHLKSGDLAKADAETRAAAHALAGFIHERYLADDDAALASYEAAAGVAPNLGRAKEAVERIRRKQESAKKAKGGKG